jgi:predicted nucleotidyltransferase
MMTRQRGRRDDAIMTNQRVSTCSQILELLRASRHEVAGFDVASLALFGSAVRGELNADSDIDILVEFAGPATFDRYMELKLFLEDLLDRPIDLVTKKALRPEMRSGIAGELLDVT